jgi:hypothetical protein
VEGVTQQLQQAMKLDRALRFGGDMGAASSALSQAQEHALNAWINFSGGEFRVEPGPRAYTQCMDQLFRSLRRARKLTIRGVRKSL